MSSYSGRSGTLLCRRAWVRVTSRVSHVQVITWTDNAFTWSLLADSLSGSRNSCVGVSGTDEDNEEHREADLGPNFWMFFQAVTQSLLWPLKGHQQDGSCLRSLQSFRLLFLPFLSVISPTALSQSSYCFTHYAPTASTFPTNTNIFIVRSNHFLWGGGGGVSLTEPRASRVTECW